MKIEHAAIWTADLEKSRRFYIDWFAVESGPRYEDAARGFSSCFLAFRFRLSS